MAAGVTGLITATKPIRGLDWLDADPYLSRHLAGHAAAGEALAELVTDVGFLAVADPERLLPALTGLTRGVGDGERIASLYRLAGGRLYEADPIERMALLHLTAHQEAPHLAPMMKPLLPPRWQCRWAHWTPSSRHLSLPAHRGEVVALGLTVLQQRAVIVSVGGDRFVRTWDASTGRLQSEHELPEAWPRALALGQMDGEPVVVCGGVYGFRLWRLREGPERPIARSRIPVHWLAMGEIDGVPVIVGERTDEGFVQVWNARTGRPRSGATMAFGSNMRSVAMGEIDGNPVIASSAHGVIRVWDARTGQLQGDALSHPSVDLLAFGAIDGEPVIVSGGGRTLRVWDARTRLPRGKPLDLPRGKPLDIGNRSVNALAVGHLGGELLIASADSNGEVCLWDARTLRPHAAPLRGHKGLVTSVALGEVEGSTVVVSGGEEGAIRVWDTTEAPRSTISQSFRLEDVRCVALGLADGDEIVVSGAESGEIRAWDARTGHPRGEPIEYSHPADSLRLAEFDGTPVILAVVDGNLRAWDARTGTQRGRGFSVGKWASSVAMAEFAGELVILSVTSGTLLVWSARTRRPWCPRVSISNYHPDGTLAAGEISGEPVAVYAGLGAIEVVDLRAGRRLSTARHGHRGVSSLAVGTIDSEPAIISGGVYDGAVKVWKLRSGRWRHRTMVGHSFVGASPTSPSVSCLAVAEIGGLSYIASGGSDQIVQLWDTRNALSVATLQPGGPVHDLALTSRGALVIATSGGLAMVDVLSQGAKMSTGGPPTSPAGA